MYLVTCRRVCFLCFTGRTEYLTLLRPDAMRKFGLRREDIVGLPSMKSVPGHYSPREIKCRSRITLIDHDAAREAGIAVHGNIDAMMQHASEITSKKLEQYESRKSSRRADGPNRMRVDPGLRMLLMGSRLMPDVFWGLFVHRCLMPVRVHRNVSFIVLHVEHIIMVDRCIGGDSL